MPLISRASLPADIEAIAAIYGHAVTTGLASFEYTPPDAVEMARRREAILAAGYPYIVAVRGNDVVGYAYVSAYRTRPGYRFTVENSIYVAPHTHRGGIGRLLLGEIIRLSTESGFRLMVAVIGDSANHGSIGLHKATGFTHAGTLPNIGWKHGRWVDSVLMTRPLGGGATTPPPSNP